MFVLLSHSQAFDPADVRGQRREGSVHGHYQFVFSSVVKGNVSTTVKMPLNDLFSGKPDEQLRQVLF